MNDHIIKQQINLLLETLSEQNEVIKSREEKIPQIELDILMQNTRLLYEALMRLNKINAAEEPIPKPILSEEEINEAPEIMNVTSQQLQNEQPDIALPKEDFTISKPEVEQKIMEERAQTISKTSRHVQQSGNLFEEAPVVARKFEIQTTVHDKISKTKEDKSWHEKLQNQPLQDLKKSIGINEKFKFMNELFDGNLTDYNQSIDALNKFNSLAEAESFIEQNLIPKHNWNKDAAIYQSFIGLINRKFSA